MGATHNPLVRFPYEAAMTVAAFYELAGEPETAKLLRADFGRVKKKVQTRRRKGSGDRLFVQRNDVREVMERDRVNGTSVSTDEAERVEWFIEGQWRYSREHLVKDRSDDKVTLWCGRKAADNVQPSEQQGDGLCRRCAVAFAGANSNVPRREAVMA